MIEVGLQLDFVHAVENAGGFAFKTANRFKAGVPDLYIQMPGFPTVMLEMKYVPKVPLNGSMLIGLTANQRRYLREIQAAGGYSSWCLVAKIDHKTHHCLVGVDPNANRVHWHDEPIIRNRGEAWPVREVLQRIIQQSQLTQKT